MGADFIWAIAPVNADKDKVLARAKILTYEECEELYHEGEHYFLGYADIVGDEEQAEFRQGVIDRLVEAIEVCYRTSRELDHLTLKGNRYVLTGGMSWGDVPTDVFDDVGLLANFDYWLERKGETL